MALVPKLELRQGQQLVMTPQLQQAIRLLQLSNVELCTFVEAEVERNGTTSRERRYYLASMPLDPLLFARAVRSHWHIENRLHWVLDVVFHEDLSRLRSGNGPQNMATVRHMAINLLRAATDKHSLKVRRKSAAWDTAYLEAILRQNA